MGMSEGRQSDIFKQNAEVEDIEMEELEDPVEVVEVPQCFICKKPFSTATALIPANLLEGDDAIAFVNTLVDMLSQHFKIDRSVYANRLDWGDRSIIMICSQCKAKGKHVKETFDWIKNLSEKVKLEHNFKYPVCMYKSLPFEDEHQLVLLAIRMGAMEGPPAISTAPHCYFSGTMPLFMDIPERIPEEMPQAITDEIPNKIPESVKEEIGEAITKETPEVIEKEAINENIPKKIPEPVKDEIHEVIAKEVLETILEQLCDSSEENVLVIVEDIPEATKQEVTEQLSEDNGKVNI